MKESAKHHNFCSVLPQNLQIFIATLVHLVKPRSSKYTLGLPSLVKADKIPQNSYSADLILTTH